MEKHKLDNLFSNKLDDLEQNPSPAAWDQLEKSLDQNSRAKIWPWVSIAASAALVVTSSWYLLTASVDNPVDNYNYADAQDKIEIPAKVILVPVIIQVYTTPALATTNSRQGAKQINKNNMQLQKSVDEIAEPTTSIAENTVLEHKLSPVLQEPLPVTEDTDEIVIASVKGTAEQESINNQKPLTIIYKKGEPEHKSKFTQALNYMGDVRNGDKKLVNFSKIKNSFKSKVKSNKVKNSK